MKATCPRCGTKAAHEMVVSVVRTWFRCVNCSYVWRGTLLSLAFSRVPLGSSFREEDAAVPLDISAGHPVASDAAGKTVTPATTAGADASLRSLELPDFDLDEPVAGEPAAGMLAAGANTPSSTVLEAPKPLRPSTSSGRAEPVEARTERRDVGSWLSQMDAELPGKPALKPHALPAEETPVAHAVAERSSADVPPPPSTEGPARRQELSDWLKEIEIELPGWKAELAAPAALGDASNLTDTAQPGISESVEDEDWLRVEDRGAVGQAAASPRQPEVSASATHQSAASAGPPPQPAPSPAAEGPRAPSPQQERTQLAVPKEESAPTGGGLASLDEVLKQLDNLYTGLAQMEERLGSSKESYAKVVEKWQPSPSDPKPSDGE